MVYKIEYGNQHLVCRYLLEKFDDQRIVYVFYVQHSDLLMMMMYQEVERLYQPSVVREFHLELRLLNISLEPCIRLQQQQGLIRRNINRFTFITNDEIIGIVKR